MSDIDKKDYKDVKSWLLKSNCQHYYSKFVENGITFDLIPELDSNSLKELGILKLGDRLRLEISIANLKKEKLINIEEIYKNLNLTNELLLNHNQSSQNVVQSGATPEFTTELANNSNQSLSQASNNTPKDINKTITFILQDGSIKKVNVTGCFNAQAIKRKILKKLGFKPHETSQFDTYIHNDQYDNNYLLEPQIQLLYDVELVTICYSPERLEKHRIMLIPKNQTPTKQAIEASRKIMNKYFKHHQNINPNIVKSNMRNFFGQRPPSELISSNLAEYFPETKQKDLEQTVRNSVRYSVQLKNLPKNLLPPNLPTRVSMMSNSTGFRSQRSISSLKNLKTIGDVMVNSINAIDEAMNSNDTISILNKPLPDNRSINSKRSTLNRISIATNENNPINHRKSTIELINFSDDEEEAEYDLNHYYDDEGSFFSSHSNSTELSNTVPDNWLKGTKIGSGSFGTVYLGMNPFTGELMAVKQINLIGDETDFSKYEEQQREMQLLKELNHENIVRYFGSSTNETHLNIFLEYVPGGSVQSMLNSYGPFEEPLIRNFIRQVLIGLNYLHNEDIIHRDIKGANILIDIKGTVKIGDFGISKKISNLIEDEENFKKTGKREQLQGSIYWMSPEVIKKSIYTKKADIWSVGCLIIEMFTGNHPFPDLSQMQALFKIGNHIVPNVPEWCTFEAKEFLLKTFDIDFERRPEAVDLLSDQFLNPLIMSKQ
ncbi:unnamed protein product [Candida verbasci]|uniref:mitogen-activated protein kinase kinase kinase n=1 Tax=Candida verbasci TaxID=1227364 RepID=A0A9W4TT65_9ASCO|nr:unnamed protein product [Candida verbasci]